MNTIIRMGLVPAVVILMVSACGILGPTEEVEVRVRNGSGILLDEIILFLPGETLTFFDLAPAQESPYRAVAKAYRMATVEVVVGQDTTRLMVDDYVGETTLRPGRYTYVLRVFSVDPLSLGLEFEKDS